MLENATALQGIFENEPPVMPASLALLDNVFSLLLLSLGALGVIVFVMFVLWRRYFSSTGRARRRLYLLQHSRSLLSNDNHQTVFLLSDILRQGLRVQQISNQTVLPEKLLGHKDRWLNFITDFSVARYSSAGYESEKIKQLMDDARFWLRHWPVKRND